MSEFTPEELESAYRDAVGRPELLPCPFCGAPGFWNDGPDVSEGTLPEIFCSGDGLTPDQMGMACPLNYHSVTMPYTVWNSRPQGWISRKDRLPTEDGPVRVWIRAYGIMDAGESVVWFSPSIQKFSFDNQHVTHWQPLSEPPTTP